MESARGKVCPFKTHNVVNIFCDEASCAWWCSFAKDCAVPLLAGMFADSNACNNIFENGEESK